MDMTTTHKATPGIVTVLLLALITGCGGGSGFGLDQLQPAAADPVEFPPPPALGAQIDRMGRSAITTALIRPLDAGTEGSGAAKDAYSAAAPAEWGDFADEIRTNLAIFDGLDANCGSQILAGAGVDEADFDTPARYDALTGALVDDRLYLRADSGACAQYFAVELAATGLLPALADDCGGRTPLYDTINVSYTALSNDLSIAVTDGITEDDSPNHSIDLFPFLAAPAE